jgi:hypothetical protein
MKNTIKVCALIIAIVLMNVISLPVFAAGAPTIVIEAQDDLSLEYEAGDEIEVTVELENNPGFTSYAMKLVYDENLLDCGLNLNVFTNMGTAKRIIAYSDSVVNGKLLATITFELTEAAKDETTVPFTIEVVEIANVSENVDFVGEPFNGIIKIKQPEPPTYGISLAPNPVNFASRTVGYATAPNAETVTLTNTGNQPTGDLEVVIADSADAFEFVGLEETIETIDVGENITFTVRPKTGLAVGTYTATVTVRGENGTPNATATLTVTFTVTSDGGSNLPPFIDNPPFIVNPVVNPGDEPGVQPGVQPSTDPSFTSTTIATEAATTATEATTVTEAVITDDLTDATIPLATGPGPEVTENTTATEETIQIEETSPPLAGIDETEETTVEEKGTDDNKENPKTGDAVLLIFAMVALAGIGTIVIVRKKFPVM